MAEVRAETVVAEVESRWGSPCAVCGLALVGQEVVASWLMGLKAAPRCLPCLTREAGCEADELAQRLAANVRRLECYRAGWLHAERRLKAAGEWPHPRVPARLGSFGAEDDPRGEAGSDLPVDARWDAGDMACGDLVLELRARLGAIAREAVLEVRATDPGAPEDLPAWCRVTGHTLAWREPPLYHIRRRAD